MKKIFTIVVLLVIGLSESYSQGFIDPKVAKCDTCVCGSKQMVANDSTYCHKASCICMLQNDSAKVKSFVRVDKIPTRNSIVLYGQGNKKVASSKKK